MNKTQLVTCALAMFAGSGCATNIRDQVSSAFATAPDWFNARAEEVKGEGYPDLRDAPGPPLIDTDDESWSAEVEKLNAAAESIRSDPKAELADP
ncbi:MAG: hypothetical protein AAGB25_04840, partial [Pseudomonadota bacterium]